MITAPFWTWLRNLERPKVIKLDDETIEKLNAMKFKPAETLDEMYEDLLSEAMRNNGYSKNPDAFKILQDHAFGVITKKEALRRLDRIDYVLWEVV